MSVVDERQVMSMQEFGALAAPKPWSTGERLPPPHVVVLTYSSLTGKWESGYLVTGDRVGIRPSWVWRVGGELADGLHILAWSILPPAPSRNL